MTSQYKMQFPFTTKKEILDWEARYLEGLSEKYQRLEPDVIKFKDIIEKKAIYRKPNC